MTFGLSSPLFLALCSSSDVPVYLTSENIGSAPCLQPLGIHLPRLSINSFQEKQYWCSSVDVLLFDVLLFPTDTGADLEVSRIN